MALNTNILTKDEKLIVISEGTSGTAGSPAIPGYWKTIEETSYVRVQGGVSTLSDGYLTFTITTPDSFRPVVTSKRVWVSEVPAVPAVEGTPPVIETSQNIGWNSGALSSLQLTGDGTLQFQVSDGSVGVIAGLSSSDAVELYDDITYGIYASHGLFNVISNNSRLTNSVAFTSSSVFCIQRIGTAIEILLDGTSIYTFDIATANALYAKCSLFAAGDAISNATIGDASTVIAAPPEQLADLYTGTQEPMVPKYISSSLRLSELSMTGYGTKAKSTSINMQLESLDLVSSQGSYAGGMLLMESLGVIGVSLPPFSGSISLGFRSNAYSVIAKGNVVPVGSNGVIGTLPSFKVKAYGGWYFKKKKTGKYAVIASATLPLSMRFAQTMSRFTAKGSGLVGIIGSMSSGFKKPLTAKGYGGGYFSKSLPGRFKAHASAMTGTSGLFIGSLSRFSAKAAGTIEIGWSANITFTSIQRVQNWGFNGGLSGLYAKAYASTSKTTDPAKYNAYCVNLEVFNTKDGASNHQVTRYKNFAFNQIVRLGDTYYGVNANGIYELGGDTDNGRPIDWSFKTHIDNFSSYKMKTLRYAYISGRIASNYDMLVQVSEDDRNTYTYSTFNQHTPNNSRVVFGKGVKAVYYGIGMCGTEKIEIDSIKLDIDELSRGVA